MSREIMQQALDAFEDLKKSVTRDGTVSENWDAYYEKEYYALEALRQALAQPEQEPVAWMYKGNFHDFDPSEWASPEFVVTPLYTAAPRKPWVGLTAEEIFEITERLTKEGGVNCDGWIVAVEVQQKLKERNT